MKVTFTKYARHYDVYVSRDRSVDLTGRGVAHDDWLPHDLLHFVIEAERGLDDGIFGVLAAGRPVKIFFPVDPKVTVKIWRQNRIKKVKVPEGRLSEELVGQIERQWRTRTAPPALQAKLDALAEQWHDLPVGGKLTLEWPRAERGKRAGRHASAEAAAHRRARSAARNTPVAARGGRAPRS